MAELNLHLEESLENKKKAFRNDGEKMGQVNDFLDDILEKAKSEADKRSKQKQKGKIVRNFCYYFRILCY